MSNIHDLGGKPGFGPVPVDDDAIFHDDWERRAFAVAQFSRRIADFNTDAFRHGIEREDPAQYVTMEYFDKWIRNAERMLVEGGVIAADAVTSKILGQSSTGEPTRTTDAEPPAGAGARRAIPTAPRFAVGDQVRAHAAPPVGPAAGIAGGHTRLSGYVAGATGKIKMLNDGWILPDSHAHGRGESPAWVYAVQFDAADLWPEDDATHTVVVDLFEPYLEPA